MTGCSSGRWPRGAISAAWPWPRPRPSGSSTPPVSPIVFIETVGVGQVEVEVAGAADTTVVVVNPGWGDAIQANKAGLLEIADIFVINKADRPGAVRDPPGPRQHAGHDLDDGRVAVPRSWPPSAPPATGTDELWAAIGEHRALPRAQR